ncbi:peptidase [Actinomadura scrupuli]|uniref:peptidase n=1 Tax=Actinomadura scrupuli TaxID=559629 RepID=UPI003D95A51D
MSPRPIVLALLVAGVLAPAADATGGPALAADRSPRNGIQIRLVDAPVKARADSRAWRYIIDHLAPGSVIHRRVEVSNTTGSPRHLSLYPAAGEIRGGKFQFAPGRTPDELSTWTAMSHRELTLGPHARSMVMTTITVPDDAAPGERYAVIWAETAAPAPRGGGVAEVNRVGVRVYLSVGRGNPPPSDFTIDSITPQRSPGGQQIVEAQVHNTGGRALDLAGDMRLTHGPGSLRAGPFKVQSGTTLLPGDSRPVTVVLGEQVPNGPWRARLRLESGLTRRTAEATITFPITMGTADAVKAETGTNYYGLAALVIVAALCVLLAVRFLGNRGSGSRP